MADLTYAIATIQIDKVDGEAHTHGVDGTAWNDPQAGPWCEMVAPEQSYVPGCLRNRGLDSSGDLKGTSAVP